MAMATLTCKGDDLLEAAKLWAAQEMPNRQATGARLVKTACEVIVEMEPIPKTEEPPAEEEEDTGGKGTPAAAEEAEEGDAKPAADEEAPAEEAPRRGGRGKGA